MDRMPEQKNINEGNAFVRVMKAIFVRDVRGKLLALLIGGLIWLVTVGLGVADSSSSVGLNAEFFSSFAANIVREFTDGTGAALSPSSVRRATSPPTFCTSSPSKLRAATP